MNRMTSSVSHPRARTSLTDVGSQSDGLYAFSFMASSDSGSFVLLLLPVLSEKQRAVAVTQETEIMGERIVVDFFPPFADECRYEQQQRALRLVKVRDQAARDAEAIARYDHDLRRGFQLLQPGVFHVPGQRLERLAPSDPLGHVVDFPLADTPALVGRSVEHKMPVREQLNLKAEQKI